MRMFATLLCLFYCGVGVIFGFTKFATCYYLWGFGFGLYFGWFGCVSDVEWCCAAAARRAERIANHAT
jgi:hypothetical protein